MLTTLIREVGSTPEIQEQVQAFRCEICERLRRQRPTRPTTAVRSEVPGMVVALAVCHWEYRVAHVCCPLSEHHRACGNQSQIWTEPTSWELFTRNIGGCVEDCMVLVQSPKKIRCDANGMLLGQSCERSCSATGTQQNMSAGETFWQVGLVEGHICVLKELLTRLYIKGCICFCGRAMEAKHTRENLHWIITDTLVHGTKRRICNPWRTKGRKNDVGVVLWACETCIGRKESMLGNGCRSHGATCTGGKKQNHCRVSTRTVGDNDNDNDNDTQSEKSRIHRMKAWPYSQECRDHDPTKKESVLLVELARWQGAQVQTVQRQNVVQRYLK